MMTGFLYRLVYDVVIQAPTKEDADEIAKTLDLGMDADIWSSEIQYQGIDEGD